MSISNRILRPIVSKTDSSQSTPKLSIDTAVAQILQVISDRLVGAETCAETLTPEFD